MLYLTTNLANKIGNEIRHRCVSNVFSCIF